MENTQSTEVAIGSTSKFSLNPKSLEEAMHFAEMLSKSSIVPKDYVGNPGNVLVAIQWGYEIGLQPMQAMQNISVINGRPAIWGDAMLALVRGSGLLESIEEEVCQDAATCTVKRKGEKPVSRTFTLEDAKRAGLAGKQGPWQQYTRRMLQMRARAWALRDVFADVLRGVHMAEEAMDMPAQAKHMGDAEQVTQVQAPANAASRAEKARSAIAQRNHPSQKQLAAPSIDEVLNAIHLAPDIQSLKQAADKAKSLQNDEEKSIARDAYANRKAELSAANVTVNAETGEIEQPPINDFLAEYDSAAPSA